MKMKYCQFLWILLISVSACGQQENKNNTDNIVKIEENAVKGKLPTNPQEIAPIDVNKLQSYTIEDYHKFWLAYKIAKINEQINSGERSGGNIVYTIENLGDGAITEKDIANGYMNVGHTFGNMGFETMALWKSKTGKATLGVASFGCGPGCDANEIHFFEIQNGELVDKTGDYLPNKEIRELLDNQHDSKLALLKKQRPTSDAKHLANWIEMPKIGTTIQFGWNHGPLDGTKASFFPVCELQYDVENGTFKLIKK